MEYNEYLELAQSTDVNNRKRVASMQDCPIEILEQLSVDKEISVLKALAKNQNSTTKILKKIITPQTKTKMYEMGSEIIQHKNCTVDILYKLLKFDFLYGNILLNPICTDDIKEQIVDFIINDFDKVYIRNSYLLYALKNVSLPKNLFEKLSKIKNVTLLEALAENINFPSEFMRNLTVVIDEGNGYAMNHIMMVAKNPNTSQELIRELYNSYQINWVINNIALNPNCPKDIMYDLAKVSYSDPDETLQLKCNLANNPNCPVDILKKLADDCEDEYVRECVAWNSNITLDMLLEFSKDENGFVRCKAALNKKCPNDILVNFYKYDNFEYKSEYEEEFQDIFEKRGIDISKYPLEKSNNEDYLKLLNSSNIEDRIKLAKMPHCPIDIWEQVLLTLDYATAKKILWHLVREPNCSKDILYKISCWSNEEYCDGEILQCLAQRDDCTLEMLEKLSNYGWEDVRYFVAQHKNVSVEILRKLSDDWDYGVLSCVLNNEKCTDDMIVRIYRYVYDYKNDSDYEYVFEKAEELIKERKIDLSKYPLEETENIEEITSDFIVNLKEIIIEETNDFSAEIDYIECDDYEYEHLCIYTNPNSSLGREKIIDLVPTMINDTKTYKYILNIEKDETDLRYRTTIKVKDDLVKALNQTISMIEETPLRCYIDDIQYIIDNI